jgi:hypothetical protein
MLNVPKVVFIVPYRNRPQHKFFFSNYLKTIMQESELKDSYELYFSHQSDTRGFNRGATKNIGFLAVKAKYPDDYKNITFVFNDIDTIPFSNLFNYETEKGTVKHFYGFEYALGGIVAISGSDFELINGFPNFWGWGMEDKVLQTRCERKGIRIDRTQFYQIGSPNILHLFDGVQRIINRKDTWRATNDEGIDGIRTIHKLSYTIDFESTNPLDNVHIVSSDNIFMVNITNFMTGTKFEQDSYHSYDLRQPQSKIVNPDRTMINKVDHINSNWTDIPFYPSSEKKKEMIKQYGAKVAKEIIDYSYENSTDPTRETLPPQLRPPIPGTTNNGDMLRQIQQYNDTMKKLNSQQRIIPPGINKFSPAYARIIAAKPKATASANIRLGGVYH